MGGGGGGGCGGLGFMISAILESEEKVSEDEETGVGGCEAVTGEGGSGGS